MNDHTRRILGPACADILDDLRRPCIPADWSYALVRSRSRTEKPFVFETIDALARHIHRKREGAAIQLHNERLLCRGEHEPRSVVTVHTLDQYGMGSRFLGWAWFTGGDRKALTDALRANEADFLRRARAA